MRLFLWLIVKRFLYVDFVGFNQLLQTVKGFLLGCKWERLKVLFLDFVGDCIFLKSAILWSNGILFVLFFIRSEWLNFFFFIRLMLTSLIIDNGMIILRNWLLNRCISNFRMLILIIFFKIMIIIRDLKMFIRGSFLISIIFFVS